MKNQPIAIVHVFYPITNDEPIEAEFLITTDPDDVLSFASELRGRERRIYIEWLDQHNGRFQTNDRGE